jgi:4-oxalomesaconate tautomerase
VAIVSASDDPDADVDYLFLQVSVDTGAVSDAQTCGNLLAGVGPFAVERGLVATGGEQTTVRIRMRNTGDFATSTFETPGGAVRYDGATRIDGVPGTGSAIELETIAARPLLPTGNVRDAIDGVDVTLVDNGMPVAIIAAADVGATGGESVEELEADTALRARLESIRFRAGALMGLGDVTDLTVPKMFLVSPPVGEGAIRTRGFIPHRVHTSIGVLMAASIAAALRVPGTVAADGARAPSGEETRIEHPTGVFDSRVRVGRDEHGIWTATSSSVRTARPLFDGWVFPRPRL